MGLTQVLASYAVRGAHVLVVETPGWWGVRAHLERAVAERGWRLAGSPADADVLAVCGRPGPELQETVGRVWEQLPGPRVRLDVATNEAVGPALEQAAADLADTAAHRADARRRPTSLRDGGDRASAVHGDHDEMAPSGISLASGGEDRDGLEMDVLHVRLGPVLMHWPAGLVLGCRLHGDVVMEAEAHWVDGGEYDEPLGAVLTGDESAALATAVRAAQRCDSITSLLALAGWSDAAVAARRVRDALLTDHDRAGEALDRLYRKVTRSRALRWSLRGLGRIDADAVSGFGLPSRLHGDVHDRLVSMLNAARAELAVAFEAVDVEDDGGPNDLQATLTALPHLVTGLDLAAARLVVASLDIHAVAARRGARHG